MCAYMYMCISFILLIARTYIYIYIYDNRSNNISNIFVKYINMYVYFINETLIDR